MSKLTNKRIIFYNINSNLMTFIQKCAFIKQLKVNYMNINIKQASAK